MNKTKTTRRELSPSVRFSVKEHLKDPEVQEAYHALETEFALVRQLINLRKKIGLSQRELAQRAGMQQPVIARLEGGRPASLGTLRRVAEALGAQVKVSLVPHTSAPKGSYSKKAAAKRSSVRG